MTQLSRCFLLLISSLLLSFRGSTDKICDCTRCTCGPLFQIKPTIFASSTCVLLLPCVQSGQYHPAMQFLDDPPSFHSSQDKKRTTSPERRLSGASSSRSPSPFTVMNDQELYMNGLARTRTASPGEFSVSKPYNLDFFVAATAAAIEI